MFAYALLHFLLYLLERFNFLEILEDLGRIYILTGLGGFIILFFMAFTSSNKKVKLLGVKNWKRLHRGVYLAGGLIFVHMLLKEKNDPIEEILLFLPLALVELLRISRWIIFQLKKLKAVQ